MTDAWLEIKDYRAYLEQMRALIRSMHHTAAVRYHGRKMAELNAERIRRHSQSVNADC